jgi:hypothetical protein
MAVNWARPSAVLAVGVDWVGEGVGFTVAAFGADAACASEETAKAAPVIRAENPRRISFLLRMVK